METSKVSETETQPGVAHVTSYTSPDKTSMESCVAVRDASPCVKVSETPSTGAPSSPTTARRTSRGRILNSTLSVAHAAMSSFVPVSNECVVSPSCT